MNKPLALIYDEFADTYEHNRGLFDMTEVLESFYRRLGKSQGRVLDLGCGAGEPFASSFIERGSRIPVRTTSPQTRSLDGAQRNPGMKPRGMNLCRVSTGGPSHRHRC